eukprot:scaffold1060_cov385-Pavlova_lutheri.AAC.35
MMPGHRAHGWCNHSLRNAKPHECSLHFSASGLCILHNTHSAPVQKDGDAFQSLWPSRRSSSSASLALSHPITWRSALALVFGKIKACPGDPVRSWLGLGGSCLFFGGSCILLM